MAVTAVSIGYLAMQEIKLEGVVQCLVLYGAKLFRVWPQYLSHSTVY